MPTNKNAQLRYRILDRCFSDRYNKYGIDDLRAKVNETLIDISGTEVSIRQIRDDIKYMRDRLTYRAPIKAYPYDGRKCYYRYSDPCFSIFNNELSEDEVLKLCATIEILKRYRGIPAHAWIEEVISSLEYRFGIKANTENVVSFDQNEQLKGLEFLSELIDCTINRQPIRMLYRTFAGSETLTVIHPYHLKQFNNRWFLIGLQEREAGNCITTRALDRIVSFSRADVPFIPNDIIDFNTHFKDIVGVTLHDEYPEVENIVLRFSPERFPYVVSKPIHHSQTADETKNIITLRVRPNKELEAIILSYGNQVEVLHPQWIRQHIINKIKANLQIYSSCAE